MQIFSALKVHFPVAKPLGNFCSLTTKEKTKVAAPTPLLPQSIKIVIRKCSTYTVKKDLKEYRFFEP
jgi:hypothetical protein